MARTRLLCACLALTAPLLTATAVQAAPLLPLPASGLTVSLDREIGGLTATRLACHPAGGPHKHAQQACDALTPVEGDFRKLEPAAGAMCTMELNPTKAALRGTWRGKKVDFEQEYSNPCVARVSTGKVFDF